MRTVAVGIIGMWVAAVPARAWSEPTGAGGRADVLAAVEDELVRLAKRAEAEAGPAHPRPSAEVAYLLLAGLATQGAEIKHPEAEEGRQLGVTHGGRARVRVFAVADDARVVIRTEAIQDKAGSWTSKRATFFRRQGGRWVERGSGSTALDGVPAADQPAAKPGAPPDRRDTR